MPSNQAAGAIHTTSNHTNRKVIEEEETVQVTLAFGLLFSKWAITTNQQLMRVIIGALCQQQLP